MTHIAVLDGLGGMIVGFVTIPNCDWILENRPICHNSPCSGKEFENQLILKKKNFFLHFFLLTSFTFHTVKDYDTVSLQQRVIKAFPPWCSELLERVTRKHQQMAYLFFLAVNSQCNGSQQKRRKSAS